MNFLWVALGGSLGAMMRFGVSVWFKLPSPWGVAFINVLGSFALGVVLGAQLKGHLSQSGFLILGTGFLGAFTTFSSLSVENYYLIEQQAWGTLAISLLGQLALGVLGVALGRGLFL